MKFYTTKVQESILSFDVGEEKHFWIKNKLKYPIKDFKMKLLIEFTEGSKAGTEYRMEIPVAYHSQRKRSLIQRLWRWLMEKVKRWRRIQRSLKMMNTSFEVLLWDARFVSPLTVSFTKKLGELRVTNIMG